MKQRQVIIIAVLLCIIFVELLVLIHLRATLVEVAGTVNALEEEKKEWQGENSLLKEQVMRARSLNSIHEKATSRGFVPALQVVLEP